ncbi:MAG: helix-hairpin-helix domain-containing protein [Cytophagales bacterium]|nr:helix-hairpin-helix domain-containing protein [Cytophagales bacterium]
MLSATAQTPPRREIDLDDFVQRLLANQKEDANYEDLYESLLMLYAHPLDLNKATRPELAALYILSDLQIDTFLAYRKKNGPLVSLYELQAVPTFDAATIQKLLPFVTVSENVTADRRPLWQRIAAEPNNVLLLRYDRTLEQKQGFAAPDTLTDGSLSRRYLGGPGRWYARYRVNHTGDFSLGFTAEKDAGEQFQWEPATRRYGADFFSAHLLLENKGRWERIAFGDYQLQLGQGLLLSAGFAVGKGAEAVETVRRHQLGIRPYTSVMEAGFLRGTAATYRIGRFRVTGFYSRVRRGASFGASDTLAERFVSSLLTAGFHRTPTELAAKNAILEQSTGGNVAYRNAAGTLELGGTLLYTHFDTPLLRSPRRYNQFEFKGTENLNVGFHGSYVWQNLNLFGEAARSSSGGVGAVAGVLGSFSEKLSLSLLWRHYDRHFHSFYGNAFGESTRNINESGVYWGIKLNPTRRITFTAYYDTYRFPWLRYRVDAPSDGFDYLLRLAYRPSKKLLLYAQYREEHRDRNPSNPTAPIHVPTRTLRRQYLFNADVQANEVLSLRSRVQFSTFEQTARTGGYALIQDANFRLKRWQLGTRLALFDTDDYDNRQYVFEKDVLYSFTVPAYYRQGLRYYLLLNYDVNSKMSVWLRFARTTLTSEPTIGSGLEEINGPTRSDVRVQVRYLFGK